MKEAERRQTQGNHRRILRCGARSFGARTLDGVPPRLSPKGIIPSQRLSFRPGFLGRGLNGRYPPSPVPVQGCTSHPGRNAGRHDAQAAREQAANPPAGTALAPMTRCASAPCPSMRAMMPFLTDRRKPCKPTGGRIPPEGQLWPKTQKAPRCPLDFGRRRPRGLPRCLKIRGIGWAFRAQSKNIGRTPPRPGATARSRCASSGFSGIPQAPFGSGKRG